GRRGVQDSLHRLGRGSSREVRPGPPPLRGQSDREDPRRSFQEELTQRRLHYAKPIHGKEDLAKVEIGQAKEDAAFTSIPFLTSTLAVPTPVNELPIEFVLPPSDDLAIARLELRRVEVEMVEVPHPPAAVDGKANELKPLRTLPGYALVEHLPRMSVNLAVKYLGPVCEVREHH